MEKSIAVMSIIVEDQSVTDKLNSLLHDQADSIIGRMGLPLKDKNVNIISVVVDAPRNTIEEMAGKLGSLPCVTVNIAYSHVVTPA